MCWRKEAGTSPRKILEGMTSELCTTISQPNYCGNSEPLAIEFAAAGGAPRRIQIPNLSIVELQVEESCNFNY